MNAEKEEQFQLGEPPASPMIPEDILEPNKWAKTSVALSKLLDCAALCNLASVFEERDEEEGGTGELTGIWAATGDPTELGAYVAFCVSAVD